MPAGLADHPCPTCAAPLVREAGGARFICSRLAEGCFESLAAGGDHPFDVTPHDGPEAAERLLAAKERLHELADLAHDLGCLPRRGPKEEYYAVFGAISLSESLLHLGRLRRWLDGRVAERGKAP